MKEELGKTIYRYRKEQDLTQEELAGRLGVTFQAVSKWETGQALPDISLIPKLCQTLEISIDRLFGYGSQEKQISIYEEEYKIHDYYWGTEPSKMCLTVLEQLPPSRHLKLLDIGCGEGKDAVFFAKNGYDVTAFDISDAGLEKTRKLAQRAGVEVKIFKADIQDFRLTSYFDILFSSGAFHYIKPELRDEILDNYKRFTNPEGIHVFNVFVKKPFIAPPPENEPTASRWISGELLNHYHDWLIRDFSEVIFDCNSSGIKHKHAMNTLVAQKSVEG